MIRSLWTAAEGMNAQQTNIDTISNNLANINNVGYKKSRVEFEDLLYQTAKLAGTPATEDTLRPVGVQLGSGAQVTATQKIFSQGAPRQTQLKTDLAVNGEGFFKVLTQDGSYAYTRNGEFKVDEQNQLVTNQGFRVIPEIVFPENTNVSDINISTSGAVNVRNPEDNSVMQIGQMNLYRFVNPAGLSSVGENLFKETPASGMSIEGEPGQTSMGSLLQGFVESSNVSAAEELVNMIVAQRAYEFNSKAITTSDSLLSTAINMKR